MPSPKTITSSVAFQDPQGNALAGGKLILDLSNPATILTSGGIIAPMRVAITLDSSGLIPTGTTIWANDQISPAGTTYLPQIEDSNGLVVSNLRFCPWSISGSSPIDLSAMTCTNIGASYPAFSGLSITVTTENSSFTAAIGNVYLVTTGSSTITATLPSATGNTNQSIMFKKVDSGSGTVDVTPPSGTIDGSATYSLTNQYQFVWVISDGTSWQVIGNN